MQLTIDVEDDNIRAEVWNWVTFRVAVEGICYPGLAYGVCPGLDSICPKLGSVCPGLDSVSPIAYAICIFLQLQHWLHLK